jgi:flagellar hook-associated protein 2
MEFALSGLASGFDWRSMVDQLSEVERAPQRRLQLEQFDLRERGSIYGSLTTELTILQNRVEELTDEDFFGSRAIAASDAEFITGEPSANAAIGTYSVNVTQMASTSSLAGTSNLGSSLNPTADVSALTLSSAAFPTLVTAGTITVNGAQVTIDTSDSLQDVFDNISTATSGAVTGSYDSGTDVISLSSASEIVLGSATDSSNFLESTRLFNNGTGTVSSSSSLGAVKQTSPLDSGNLVTPITDGGSGAGEFTINGVSISYDTSADSLGNILSRINASEAGVSANYDRVNDQITLSNKETGDLGVGVADVTGNFMAAVGLSSGTLTRGDNLLYSVNGGGAQASFSNTVSTTNSSISGLSFTAHQIGTASLTVSSDREKIEGGINNFISQFNKVQGFVDTNTASTTDSSGKVTSGVLQSETEAEDVAAGLRSIVVGEVSGLSAVLNRLSDIGIDTNGYDNNLEISDTELFDESLVNDLSKIQTLFQDPTDGIATLLDTFVESQVGDEGIIANKIDLLSEQDAGIDDQIERLERNVQANKERLISSFVSMETAQSQINSQLQFLQQRFGGA